MIWNRGQSLRRVECAEGTVWHFLIGFDFTDGIMMERIFFWDEAKEITGLLELRGEACLHLRRIKDRMKRLANDSEYRRQFLRPLDFPVERYW